jgi:hypothetical protein
MVVLARAAGVPARLVTGYAGGQYDTADDQYVVTAADAHSWVEIFFPGFGWVEFEPTAGLPAIQRQVISSSGETVPEISPPDPGNRFAITLRWNLLPRLLAIIFAFSGLAAFASIGFDAMRLRFLPPSRAIFVLFRRLQRIGLRLAIPRITSSTPHEFGAALNDRMSSVLRQSRLGDSVSLITEDIGLLTHLYARSLYSRHPITPVEKSRAVRIWAGLRWKLLFAAAIEGVVHSHKRRRRESVP